MVFRITFGQTDARYGQGVHKIHDDELAAEGEAEQIALRMRQTFQAPGYAPPVLPAAAMEVHRLSQRADVDVRAVLSALEKDPMLAARVLRIASSPMFGTQAIQSLQGAILRLGLKALTQIVWEVAMGMKVFRSKQYAGAMDVVRKHSTVTAYFCRMVAMRTHVSAEYAFMCGLLHDVGMAAALLLLSSGGANAELSPEMLGRVLGKSHAEASALIAKLWGMPPDMQVVLASHHALSGKNEIHPVVAVLCIAEMLAEEFGYGGQFGNGQYGPDLTSERVRFVAQHAMNLDDNRMIALRTEGEQILAQLGPTLGAA